MWLLTQCSFMAFNVKLYFFSCFLKFCKTIVRSKKTVVRTGRLPVRRTPLGARPGLGTQPRYEAPRDPRVEAM